MTCMVSVRVKAVSCIYRGGVRGQYETLSLGPAKKSSGSINFFEG